MNNSLSSTKCAGDRFNQKSVSYQKYVYQRQGITVQKAKKPMVMNKTHTHTVSHTQQFPHAENGIHLKLIIINSNNLTRHFIHGQFDYLTPKANTWLCITF